MEWLYQLVGIISIILRIYKWALFAYILMSWVPNLLHSPFGHFLGRICEPFLEPFRRIIPPIGGMIDISPWLAFIVLWFAQLGLAALPGLILG
ncbi:YggT family protein [Camelliibacillus cellulosilyticus]|uniref:YggT family protein n=1 Tax=Camelliibacillus cellulosilyticus TaxID=2174486 RepID=A0ABV9GKS1_9BACL